MDRTIKITFIVGLFVSLVFLYGFKTVSKAIRYSNQHVSVSTSGSAEKIVKSDVAELRIFIKNKDESFSKLNEKRVADKQAVLDFLKTCGLDEKDVISVKIKSENKGEKGTKISHKEQNFGSEDTVSIRTKNFEAVDKIKNQIMELASKGVVASYKCVYKILNLDSIKYTLMAEAAKNAEKEANALLAPFKKRVKKIISLHSYSEPSVMNETSDYRWDSSGENSLMKKVKMNVSANFSYE